MGQPLYKSALRFIPNHKQDIILLIHNRCLKSFDASCIYLKLGLLYLHQVPWGTLRVLPGEGDSGHACRIPPPRPCRETRRGQVRPSPGVQMGPQLGPPCEHILHTRLCVHTHAHSHSSCVYTQAHACPRGPADVHVNTQSKFTHTCQGAPICTNVCTRALLCTLIDTHTRQMTRCIHVHTHPALRRNQAPWALPPLSKPPLAHGPFSVPWAPPQPAWAPRGWKEPHHPSTKLPHCPCQVGPTHMCSPAARGTHPCTSQRVLWEERGQNQEPSNH